MSNEPNNEQIARLTKKKMISFSSVVKINEYMLNRVTKMA